MINITLLTLHLFPHLILTALIKKCIYYSCFGEAMLLGFQISMTPDPWML